MSSSAFNKNLALLFASVVVVVGCGPSYDPSGMHPKGRGYVTQAGGPLNPVMIAQSQNRTQIYRLMEAGRFTEAEALVDAAQDEPGYGSFIPLHKAELLARRGAKAEALALYLDVLRDPKMYWNPSSRELAPALDLAVDLGRTADADVLATRMIAHPSIGFYDDPGVQTPREAESAKERLAYAYLLIGADSWMGDRWVTDPDHAVLYVSKAHALLPNSVPVLTQLAFAYDHRNKPGDKDRALALYRRALARASGAATRAEIKKIGHSLGERLETGA